MRFDEVLEKLTELHQVGAHGRQFVADDYRLFFIDGDLQTIERVFYRGCGFDRRRRSSLHIDTRLDEQILDDDLHALGVVDQECMYFAASSSSESPKSLQKQFGVDRHPAQRLLQIMGGDIGELFQLRV